MKKLALACALLSLATVGTAAPAQSQSPEPRDLASLTEALMRDKDASDPAWVYRLARLRTREALDALIEVYDTLGSIYLRRVAIEGMVVYDQVPEADQVALQKMMDIATEDRARELRLTAVDCISQCEHLGKPFLRMIVESSAEDDVRELALSYHTEAPRPDDVDWYREIYTPSALVRARKAAKKTADDKHKVPHKIPTLRALAFEALVPQLSDEELVTAVDDRVRMIRMAALEELDRRGGSAGVAAAQAVYKEPMEDPRLRLVAVSILAKQNDERFNARLIKDALRKDSTREFMYGVADVLAQSENPEVQQTLVRGLGRGPSHEKLFYLRAAGHIQEPKVDKALEKLCSDRDPDVQREAIAVIAARGDAAMMPRLVKVVEREKDPSVAATAVVAISDMGGFEDWPRTLAQLTRYEDEDVRNAAVQEIGKLGDPEYFPALYDALEHEQWSTRIKAARAIEVMGLEEGVEALCMQMEHEQGRVLAEYADILWRMTGQPFRSNAASWKRWWEDEGDKFAILSEEEVRRLKEAEELEQLKQITSTTFFGIRVVSHRVIFIIDISGSMEAPTRGQFVGEVGDTRMNVAKREIEQCLESLDVESLFNIITFADSAMAWQDRVSDWTNVSQQEAVDYIRRQQAFGQTNLFSALEIAFQDPIVDTIYVLSDGIPTVGVQDPATIRDKVADWNRYRGVVLNCIAVGGGLEILAWLAEDSGGQYVRIP